MPNKITLKNWKLYTAEEPDRTVKVIATNKTQAAEMIGRNRNELTEVKGADARNQIRRAFNVPDKRKRN